MMERLRGPRPERRVDEPRGRREDDHRTIGRVEAVGRMLVQPLVVKLALAGLGVAAGWSVALYRLPEGHAQLAKTVRADSARASEFMEESRADRGALHVQLDQVTARLDSTRSGVEDLKTGVCLQTPLDYRPLMKCDPSLPPPRRIP